MKLMKFKIGADEIILPIGTFGLSKINVDEGECTDTFHYHMWRISGSKDSYWKLTKEEYERAVSFLTENNRLAYD